MSYAARVHRLDKKVAIHLGPATHCTVYLTAQQAYELGHALLDCSTDVVTSDFVDSEFGEREIERNPNGGN